MIESLGFDCPNFLVFRMKITSFQILSICLLKIHSIKISVQCLRTVSASGDSWVAFMTVTIFYHKNMQIPIVFLWPEILYLGKCISINILSDPELNSDLFGTLESLKSIHRKRGNSFIFMSYLL